MRIKPETREKFREWSGELSKLSKEEQEKEARVWIDSALNILDQNDE